MNVHGHSMRFTQFIGAISFALIGVIQGLNFSIPVAAAGAASITLSPSSQTLALNDTITMTVAVNPAGEAVIGTQVKLNYDASKLQLQSLSENTSPLDTALLNNASSGTVLVTRATFGEGSTNTFNFMQITFKTIATGSAKVSVQPDTEVTRANDGSNSWNGVQTAAIYTITGQASTPSTPPPLPPPSPAPSPAPSPDPTPAPAPTPDPLPEDLIVNELSIDNTLRQVIFSFNTSAPVRAKILYGLDGSTAIASQETELTKSPVISIDRKTIVPGRTYTYTLVLTQEDGTVSQSDPKTFRAKGYRVRFILRDVKGRQIKKQRVRLHSEPREATSDDRGEVVFDDVEAGNHTLSFNVAGESISRPITIAENDDSASSTLSSNPPEQKLEISVDKEAISDTPTDLKLVYMTSGIGGLIVLGLGYILIRQRQQQRKH